jgi:hypothetical protein
VEQNPEDEESLGYFGSYFFPDRGRKFMYGMKAGKARSF